MSDKSERAERGAETFATVVGRPMHPPGSPFTEAARDFVFAEVWSRPGLDLRSRRWITLACVCAARAPMAIKTYIEAALDSGDITEDEMREFVLQFGVFQGFPKAAEVEIILGQILKDRAAR
ncbi:carboxymuconolactone decarboxylase family protein [Phenylobacterium sp. LjRoot225]|uniref:carboxymuconolactone decarboxylase family protein n=1 Tax=Phenylobacterium sp. LjRoot225 TaxID=3342285 RepID=UPI003ECD7846